MEGFVNPFTEGEEAGVDKAYGPKFGDADFEKWPRERVKEGIGTVQPPEGAYERLRERLRQQGHDI